MTADPEPPAPAPMRAVLDTSSLISEHRHWLWLLAQRGYYQGIWSTFIVGEMVRVRVELSAARGTPRATYRRRINDLIHLLSDVLLVADYRNAPSTAGALGDPDDEPILAAALAAGAEAIVSLNTRDFPAGGAALGVRFLTPTEFLAELAARHPDANVSGEATGSGRALP